MYEAPFWTQAVPVMGAFLVFYLLIIRPVRFKEAERRKAVKNLKPRNQVVTYSGLKGIFVSADVESNTILVEISNAITIQITHDGIETVVVNQTEQNKP